MCTCVSVSVNFSAIFFNSVIRLKLQPKPIASTIDAGAQAQQLVNIECLGPFNTEPTVAITFT